jgi:hypothetical protein
MSVEKFSMKIGKQILVLLDLVNLHQFDLVVEKIKSLGGHELFTNTYSFLISHEGAKSDLGNIIDELGQVLELDDKLLFVYPDENLGLVGEFMLVRDASAAGGIKVVRE